METNIENLQQMQGLVAELIKVNTGYVEAIVARDGLVLAQERRIAELEQRVKELDCVYGDVKGSEVSE